MYDFFFVVITTRFYQKTYNKKVSSRLNEVKQFYSALINCYCKKEKHINHVICDRVNNSIKQLKSKIESITRKKFHLVGKFHQNLCKNELTIELEQSNTKRC